VKLQRLAVTGVTLLLVAAVFFLAIFSFIIIINTRELLSDNALMDKITVSLNASESANKLPRMYVKHSDLFE